MYLTTCLVKNSEELYWTGKDFQEFYFGKVFNMKTPYTSEKIILEEEIDGRVYSWQNLKLECQCQECQEFGHNFKHVLNIEKVSVLTPPSCEGARVKSLITPKQELAGVRFGDLEPISFQNIPSKKELKTIAEKIALKVIWAYPKSQPRALMLNNIPFPIILELLPILKKQKTKALFAFSNSVIENNSQEIEHLGFQEFNK